VEVLPPRGGLTRISSSTVLASHLLPLPEQAKCLNQHDILLSGELGHDGVFRVGFLPQTAAATLTPARGVGVALHELVGLERPRLPRAQRRARVAQILATAAFDVADADRDAVLRRYPFEFSGGERARLALAQVLAVRPDVLVIDEPTVGLDPLARAALLRSLATLRGQGAAILLVTHDPVAERAGDRTLYVHGGRIVEELPPEPVASEPGGKPTAAPSAPVLRLRGVTVTLHRRRILHEIDLAVRAGELLAILGVSGAGKSTIARCMAGLVAPRHGAVLLDDQPLPVLRRRSRAQIAQVQYVWQESASSFDPRRPVLDQVAATAVRLRGLARDAARAAAPAPHPPPPRPPPRPPAPPPIFIFPARSPGTAQGCGGAACRRGEPVAVEDQRIRAHRRRRGAAQDGRHLRPVG
ncbi:ATP-binding cassette domain-containing protein, partial [Nocardia farcinica]|uniref:ATP-binding cassette domain-containing protein n=1 Tax=Nocardia farcinica TaxID=37329 RepID=UPI002457C136